MVRAMNASRVAETVWPWRDAADPDKKESPAKRRIRAVIEACVAYTVALVLAFYFDKREMAIVVVAIASIGLIGGLFIPPLYAGFKWFFMLIAKFIVTAFTWVLLSLVFYICFTCGRISSLAKRKDPLQRKFDPEQKSYWSKRREVKNAESYRRQY